MSWGSEKENSIPKERVVHEPDEFKIERPDIQDLSLSDSFDRKLKMSNFNEDLRDDGQPNVALLGEKIVEGTHAMQLLDPEPRANLRARLLSQQEIWRTATDGDLEQDHPALPHEGVNGNANGIDLEENNMSRDNLAEHFRHLGIVGVGGSRYGGGLGIGTNSPLCGAKNWRLFTLIR